MFSPPRLISSAMKSSQTCKYIYWFREITFWTFVDKQADLIPSTVTETVS